MRVIDSREQVVDGKLRVGIVASRFNRAIVQRMLDSCLDTLTQRGVADEGITLVRVPGAFEIPLAVKYLLAKQAPNVVITLGAVVRGKTPHFDFIAGECSRGIAQLALDSGIPVVFGVLTVDSMAQAEQRVEGRSGGRGAASALTALEMACLVRSLPASGQ